MDLLDRVGVSCATTGTGTMTLGSALSAISPNLCQFFAPSSVGATDQHSYRYLILDSNGGVEIGYGLYTASGTTLTRNVTWSTNSNAAINLSGNEQVFITAAAEDIVTQAQLPGGLINKFRNGTMDVWQRGTSLSGTLAAFAYTADGWMVQFSGAAGTVARASNNRTNARSLYGLQITGATSCTGIQVQQRIESNIAASLNGKTVTVQAQVFNNTGGSITPTLTVLHPTAQDNYASIGSELNTTNLQACANSAWTQVAYTLTLSSSVTNGIEVLFDFGNNFSTTGKSAIVAELDIRETPGLPTGLNYNPPPPEMRPISSELAFNQRYYYSVTSYYIGLALNSGSPYNGIIRFPVTMFKAPTLQSGSSFSVSTGSAGTPQIRTSGGPTVDMAAFGNSANNWTTNADITVTAAFGAEI